MVGSHLADYILTNHSNVEVHGLIRWRSPRENILHIENKVILHNGDLHDLNSLINVVNVVRPDRVFHLAGQSYVMDSFNQPAETLSLNIIGTVNLLDSIRYFELDPLIHICSSSEVYGQVSEDELPITETVALRPASPYAVSKVGEDMVAYQYFVSYGLRTIRTRMFTHTGPRRGDVFSESAFARQIAEIEAGVHHDGVLKVGNLESMRTYADVRDAVRAYWLLLEKCVPGEVYNIGGDQSISVGKMLDILKGLSTKSINHDVCLTLLRPSDVTLQIPDVRKFKNMTGWEPEIPLEQTLEDLLAYHRKKIATMVCF